MRTGVFGVLLFLPAMISAATHVFYSVGTNTADLKSGDPTITIASGIATFSLAQPHHIGVGDEITYGGGSKCYISGRSSATVYNVTTAAGASPADVSGQGVTSIFRAFNSLSVAVTGAGNASHLNTMDLVAGNLALHLACYGDGNDVSQAVLDGWTTGPSNFVRIFTPVVSSEVGQSQRHSGKWTSGGAYILKIPSVTAGDMLTIRDDYVRVDGLQIDAFGSNATGQDGINLHLSATADVRISNCILKGPKVPSTAIGKNGTGNFYAWNNILYDWHGAAGANGFGIWGNGAILYNNTVYGCYWGINGGYSTGIVLKNNLFYANTDNVSDAAGYSGTNNLSGPYAESIMPATGARNGVNVAFVDSANDDFRLASNDAGARNYGADLSADAGLPFSTDIEGQTRSGSWDIGADEYVEITDSVPPVMGSVSQPAANAEWRCGSTQTIQWSGTDETALSRFHLDYSLNNGSSWISIGDTLFPGASFGGGKAWSIPGNIVTAQGKIRVIAIDAGNNSDTAESAVFNIVDQTLPAVSVALPAGGSTLQEGNETTIRWTASDNIAVSACSLYYTTNGTSWTAIAARPGTDSTFSWTVTGPAASSAQIQVRARDAAGNVGIGTSAVFTITTPDTTPPVVSGVALSGNPSTIGSGSGQTIVWSASDNVAVVLCTVWVSYDNGSNYLFLAQVSGSSLTSGSQAWSVPASRTAAAARIKVGVYDAAGKKAEDMSGTFVIEDQTPPSVALQSPNGNEVWPATSMQTIRWTASDSVGITACSLFYSTDKSNWTLVWDTTANTAAYGWKIPQMASSICQVKVVVRDARGNAASDSSDAPFSVTRSPYVSSPDSVVVTGGQRLNYSLTYDAGGQSGTPSFAFSPDFVQPYPMRVFGNLVTATAVPATPAPRIDTLIIRFEYGDFVEDFKLRVIVEEAATGMASVIAAPRKMGLTAAPSRMGVVFHLALDRSDDFELSIYSVSGRKVWSHRLGHAVPGYYTAPWNPEKAINGSYVAELRSNHRILRQKFALVR